MGGDPLEELTQWLDAQVSMANRAVEFCHSQGATSREEYHLGRARGFEEAKAELERLQRGDDDGRLTLAP